MNGLSLGGISKEAGQVSNLEQEGVSVSKYQLKIALIDSFNKLFETLGRNS